MSIADDLDRAAAIIDDARQVYAHARDGPLPAPLGIALPLLYKHVVLRTPRDGLAADAIAIAGHALLRQYPQLRAYYLSPQQQRAAQDLHTILSDALRD